MEDGKHQCYIEPVNREQQSRLQDQRNGDKIINNKLIDFEGARGWNIT